MTKTPPAFEGTIKETSLDARSAAPIDPTVRNSQSDWLSVFDQVREERIWAILGLGDDDEAG